MRRNTLELINSAVADAEAASAIASAVDDEINELQSKVDDLELHEDDQYNIFDDDTTQVRIGVRATKFVVDRTLTATGFAGEEDTDWENIQELPGA